MSDVVHTSRVRLEKVKGPIRHAYVEGFAEPIRVGVHGGIKKYYGVEPEEDLPATLDYLIVAITSCLLGTLTAALEVRQIPAEPGKVNATVEGDIAPIDKILRVTEIRVHYDIRIPPGKREAAERAVATHEQKCPAASSVRGCIPIKISASIVEE
jgi:uncharacterized OsmC-like protein